MLYPFAAGTGSPAIGDLNGDGLADVAAVADSTTSSGLPTNVSVLLNKGDGSLETPVPYLVADAITVAIGDLNHDGAADLAVAGIGEACVLLNNGDGTFAAAVCYPGGSAAGGGFVRLGDVNGDGVADLVVADWGKGDGSDSGVNVFLNDGNGTLTPPAGYLPVSSPTVFRSVAVVDLNGDGRLDLATADHYVPSINDGRAGVFINDGSGTFRSEVEYSVTGDPSSGAAPTSIATADLNGDGTVDAAVTYSDRRPFQIGQEPRGVCVLFNDGKGALGSPETYIVGLNPSSVALGDLNGDGTTDLAVANGGTGMVMGGIPPGTASVLLNRGEGSFAPSIDFSVGSPQITVSSIALGNLNRDAALDMVVTADTGIFVFLSGPR